MRLIDADKLYPDCVTKNGTLAISQSQISEAPIVERLTGEWIPIIERMPDNETEVLIQFQYDQSIMVGYHIFDFTVYPSEFKDENETGWYDRKDNFICCSDEVVAWMPLPKPYKGEGKE